MIYFLRHPETGNIKIGTTETFNARMRGLKNEHGELDFLGFIEGDRFAETALHGRFNQYNVTVHGGREWFSPSDEIIAFINENASFNVPAENGWVDLPVLNVTEGLAHIIVGKERARTGKAPSANSVIWDALRLLDKEAVKMVEEEMAKSEQPPKKDQGQ